MLSNVNSAPSSWVTLATSQRRRLGLWAYDHWSGECSCRIEWPIFLNKMNRSKRIANQNALINTSFGAPRKNEGTVTTAKYSSMSLIVLASMFRIQHWHGDGSFRCDSSRLMKAHCYRRSAIGVPGSRWNTNWLGSDRLIIHCCTRDVEDAWLLGLLLSLNAKAIIQNFITVYTLCLKKLHRWA